MPVNTLTDHKNSAVRGSSGTFGEAEGVNMLTDSTDSAVSGSPGTFGEAEWITTLGTPNIPVSVKHDSGKPAMHLVPPALPLGAARAYGFGAVKYAPFNWAGDSATPPIVEERLYDAVMRHMFDYMQGVTADEESGLHPLDHAAASLGMLMSIRDGSYVKLKPLGATSVIACR